MNIDRIKEELIKAKMYLSNNNLSEEEEKELDIFIEGLVLDLQNKVKKINYENIAENIRKIIQEEKDV